MITTATREYPILFSPKMVQAILANQKSVTRRVVKWKPREDGLNVSFSGLEAGHYSTGHPESGWVLRSRGRGACWNDRTFPARCPYGRVGDRLWVRETFAIECNRGYEYDAPDVQLGPIRWHEEEDYGRWFECPHYRASEPDISLVTDDHEDFDDRTRWTPSIYMPRWASRITLEVTGVRVERLHQITEDDARAEGFGPGFVPAPHPEFADIQTTRCVGYRPLFVKMWDVINGKKYPWASNPHVWVVSFRVAEACR